MSSTGYPEQNHLGFLPDETIPTRFNDVSSGLNWAEIFQTYRSKAEHQKLYDKYIRSSEWKQKADEAKKRAGYRCQVCNRGEPEITLSAHHRTYERLGNENPMDLTVLCDEHHHLFHINDNVSSSERKPISTEGWEALFKTYRPKPEYRALYLKYLQSPEWNQKARQAKVRAEWRCQSCGKPECEVSLKAYHRSYDRVGHEEPDDITVLCPECYGLHGAKGDRISQSRRSARSNPSRTSYVDEQRPASYGQFAVNRSQISAPSVPTSTQAKVHLKTIPLPSGQQAVLPPNLAAPRPEDSIQTSRQISRTPTWQTGYEKSGPSGVTMLTAVLIGAAVLWIGYIFSSNTPTRTNVPQSVATNSGSVESDCDGGICATTLAGATVHAMPNPNSMIIRKHGVGDSIGLIGRYVLDDSNEVWYRPSTGGWISKGSIENPPSGLPFIDVPTAKVEQPTATATPQPKPTPTPKRNVASRR